ncbi:Nematode cuticle collagen, partial [Aphelenchoides avenae]
MSAKAVVVLASAASGLAIIGALMVVSFLFQDINDLHDEVMADMSEFKEIANNAWREMVEIETPVSTGQTGAITFGSIFGRHKRQAGKC